MENKMKAGFNSDAYEMSLPEIAAVLNIHTSTVHEIQQNAFRKIRLYCETNNIVFEDLIDSLSTMKGTK
jgi:DNA-directed RNA polymerase sigma subunit (sigma70/sigma32)